MGTNYYARILPKRKQKEALKTLIDNDEFDKIKTQVEKIYGSYQMTSYDGESGGEIHLGKRSAGWKFLWNPNIYIIRNGHIEWIDNGNGHKTGEWIIDPNTYHFVYPLTKEGIKSFIDREDVVIYDEYDDTSDVNWAEEYHSNDYHTPIQLIEILGKVLKDAQLQGRYYLSESYTKALIKECEGWIENETEYIEN